MSEDNDIIVRVGRGREIARVTIPGAAGRVAAFNATFLPGDNTKSQDLTVQLHDGPAEGAVEVVESQVIIGLAPNVVITRDEDDEPEDDE